ncbi:XRE family transcriptional regulator [Geoanaerobacter pelophilus]|uniref:XRE family transcriptional regulator n=1 Tax=Geoanaerobacter pelophilus TaxID=60036 RepID=A0ABQ0MFK5_9BACT|nr:helix-turn-helix domain-containing protein [Geoanaerobacter pelophilus]GAW65876.1 XRE family transcriptional regulator [Geoanaerobacter pelophilus]
MSDPEQNMDAEVPVGRYLKGVREARGLKLEDASQVTKIGKNYLVAIEEGQFEKLPNVAYIKGFLRLYAGYLSLSGDEVVARYERELAPAAKPQAEPAQPRPGMETVEKSKLAGPGRWIIPAFLLVLVVITALFYSDADEPPPLPRPAPPAPLPAPVLAPMTSPVQKQLSSARPAPLAEPAAEPSRDAAPAGRQKGVVLKLRFNRDSWLSITIDDSISQRYDLKAGDIIEWKGQRSFSLELGDGGAVEGEFNGRPLQALGQAGQPAHVELKAEQ